METHVSESLADENRAETIASVAPASEKEEIVLIGDSDRESVLGIIEEIHGAVIADRAAFLWNWKFVHNPYKQSDRPTMIGFKQGGKLMGCVLSIPFLLKTEMGVFQATWPVDHVMSRKVKSKSLIASSMKMCRMLTENNDFCPGQPVIGLEKLWARIMKMKSVLIGDYSFYHAVLKIDKILMTRFHFPAVLAGFVNLFWRAFGKTRQMIARPKVDPKIEFEKVHSIPSEINRLWEEVSPAIPKLAVRHQESLNWRFLQMPDKDRYEVRVARREGRVVGYIVLSLEQANGLRKALLVDIFGDIKDQLLWNSLIAEAIRWSRSQGADLLTAVELTLPELAGLLPSHSFFRGKRFMRFINNTWLSQFRNNPASFDRAQWFFTYADHDCEYT